MCLEETPSPGTAKPRQIRFTASRIPPVSFARIPQIKVAGCMTSRTNTNNRVGRQMATNTKADRKHPHAKQCSSVSWLLQAAKATILSPHCRAGLLLRLVSMPGQAFPAWTPWGSCLAWGKATPKQEMLLSLAQQADQCSVKMLEAKEYTHKDDWMVGNW